MKRMMNTMLLRTIALGTLFLCTLSYAAESTPIGSWRTYDLDRTARSIVRFSIVNNTLQGRIVKVLSPAKGQTSHNMAAPGKIVVWGLVKKGDEWVNGHVLDTDTGNSYRCTVSVAPNNQVLNLHAYVALPILGKTVYWARVAP